MFLVSSLCVGGSEKKTVSVVNRLVRRGWRIHLGVLGGPEDLLSSVSREVPILALARRRRVDMQAIRRLRAYLIGQRVGFLWSVNQYPMLYARLAARGAPFAIRQVVGINTTDFHSSYERLQMFLYSPLLRRMDTVVFGSAAQQRAWVARYRLPTERVRVIHNGVDLDYFAEIAPARSRAQGGARLTLGMVAQFRPEKGHRILLKAIARLRKEGLWIRVILIGDGPELQAVRGLATHLGLREAVDFVGRVTDVRPCLSAIDVFVLPSLAVETFSNAALEAMAAGLPVILSDIGGASEMIVDGECGALCPPGNVGALAAAIRRVSDPSTRFAWGTAARARVAARFSIEAMLKTYEDVLRC